MPVAESQFRKQSVIAELMKSTHGDLNSYRQVGGMASHYDPEFFAHLIAYNQIKGEVRDSKIALPVLALRDTHGQAVYKEYRENAAAHLSLADPRTLLRGLKFAREIGVKVKALRSIIERYLREREAVPAWFDKVAVQHRKSLIDLYSHYHIKPAPRADAILFKRLYPGNSVFDVISHLKDMDPIMAAGLVIKHKVPFLIAQGALGPKLKNPDVLLAVIQRMTPAELITNMKMLEKLGVRKVPALRSALEEGLQKAAESRKVSTPTFKATRAQEAVTDEALKAKLGALQEKRVKEVGIEGDWLVLGDKSGSMSRAIDTARLVAGTLAKAVKGRVLLVFFDSDPRMVEVTGKTYEEILALTKSVRAGGGTSIGCGLEAALAVHGFIPEGIVIVSDGGENERPMFADVYARMAKAQDVTPPVYLYLVADSHGRNSNVFGAHMDRVGLPLTTFDLINSPVDYYSLPNLIKTMRVNRYSLVQEILDTELLTLDEVYKTRWARDQKEG